MNLPYAGRALAFKVFGYPSGEAAVDSRLLGDRLTALARVTLTINTAPKSQFSPKNPQFALDRREKRH